MAQASAVKLKQTGPSKKDGLSATKFAVGKDAKAVFAKRKKNRTICSFHQIVKRERIKVSGNMSRKE